MGRTIRLDASKETKIADARSASTGAAARGGLWGSLAAERLGPILTLFDGVEADLKEAEEQAATLIAARDVERGRARDLVGRTHDQLWNDVGRPGHDPAFALIFPGGIGYYVECDVASQPKRMLLLAAGGRAPRSGRPRDQPQRGDGARQAEEALQGRGLQRGGDPRGHPEPREDDAEEADDRDPGPAERRLRAVWAGRLTLPSPPPPI